MKNLYVTENLGAKGYRIESEVGRYAVVISRETLVDIIRKGVVAGFEVRVINSLDEEIELYSVDVEDYDTEYDVVVKKFAITEDSYEMEYSELNEYTKTYKRESSANKYADQVKKELEFLNA